MDNYEQELFEKMSLDMQFAFSTLKDYFGEKSCSLRSCTNKTIIDIKIKVNDTEIYGDIKNDKVFLKTSSGPNILEEEFVSTLAHLRECLIDDCELKVGNWRE